MLMSKQTDPLHNRIALCQQLASMRKLICKDSLLLFAELYLGHHFILPGSVMHREMAKLLTDASNKRNARIAIAAPRGHAKSTLVSLAYVLWSICYGREKYVVIISDTADQSVDLVTTIKGELETNPLLIEDFPEVAEPHGRKPAPKRWRKAEFITRNEAKVLALGAGQKIRGRKHGRHRPTLIILDDSENEADVDSPDQRESRRKWFHKAVMNAGTTAHTNVVVVGTILHYESLLSELIDGKKHGWSARKYKAVLSWANRDDLWQKWQEIYTYIGQFEDRAGPEAAEAYFKANCETMLDGTEVLWPELENYLQLMEIRLRDGQASFDSEKQNDPIDPASSLFDMQAARYWDDTYASDQELMADLGGDFKILGACDPSMGMAGRSRDYTAIITLAKHEQTGNLYLLDAFIGKLKPKQIIQKIIEYQRIRKYARFGIETNQFQDFLADELIRISNTEGVYVPIKKIKHTSDKLGRIQSLEPLISTGMLSLSRRHQKLLDQLRQFPKAAHDDGPDALEMAVEVAIKSDYLCGMYKIRGF